MPPDVHRDPELLRAHAAAAQELADALAAALRSADRPAAFEGRHAEELEDLERAVSRAVRELSHLGAELAAAAAVEGADDAADQALRRAAERS